MHYTDIAFRTNKDDSYFMSILFSKLHAFSNEENFGIYFPFYKNNPVLNEIVQKQDFKKYATLGSVLRLLGDTAESVEELLVKVGLKELEQKGIASYKQALPVPAVSANSVCVYRWRPSYIEKTLSGDLLESAKEEYLKTLHTAAYFKYMSNTNKHRFMYLFKQEISTEPSVASLEGLTSYGTSNSSNKIWLPYF